MLIKQLLKQTKVSNAHRPNNIHKPKPSFFPMGSTKKKITCTRKQFELENVTNQNFNIKILYEKKKKKKKNCKLQLTRAFLLYQFTLVFLYSGN